MKRGISIPSEPLEIKKTLRALYEAQGGRRAKFIVFTGGQLPKYLWDHWADDLHKQGLKWQDLLRSLSENYERALAWVTGEASWSEFVEAVIADLMSGRPGAGERGAVKKRTLIDYL